IACRAVGGSEEAVIPAAAATFCALASIHLVDDMLDDDPAGDYHRLGVGNTANLALAFQAAGHRVLDDPRFDNSVRSESQPLFGGAFYLGARLGGAAAEVASQMETLGGLIGLFIQVSDDLGDSLKTPAGADWNRRFNNLAILYALTADHPEREAFDRASANAGDAKALEEAQKILLRSGAVSYCALKLIELSRQARELLAEIPLHSAEPIEHLLGVQMEPLDQLFRSI